MKYEGAVLIFSLLTVHQVSLIIWQWYVSANKAIIFPAREVKLYAINKIYEYFIHSYTKREFTLHILSDSRFVYERWIPAYRRELRIVIKRYDVIDFPKKTSYIKREFSLLKCEYTKRQFTFNIRSVNRLIYEAWIHA